MIRNKQHGENRRHTGATRLMQITLAAAWRARARTGYSQYSECAGGETVVTGQCVPLGAPTHTTYQRAVKTAALHAFHTGGHKEREKKLFKNGNTYKQAVLASRGPLAAVQAARDRFPASGGKMRRYQHATGPRRIDHGAAATATGHGPRGMEHGPCGCGRRSRSPGGRGRRRLGGRGTCLSGGMP